MVKFLLKNIWCPGLVLLFMSLGHITTSRVWGISDIFYFILITSLLYVSMYYFLEKE